MEGITAVGSAVLWTTPNKASELIDQLRLYSQLGGTDPTQRLLFRKLQKSWDILEFERELACQRVEGLEYEAKLKKAITKKKVEISPNFKFATIEDVRRAHEEIISISSESSQSDDSNDTESIYSTIVVAGLEELE